MADQHHALGQMVEKIGDYAIIEAISSTPDDEPVFFVVGPRLGPELPTGPLALKWARHLAETANQNV